MFLGVRRGGLRQIHDIGAAVRILYDRDPATGVGRRTFAWPHTPEDVRKLICLPYAGGNSTVFRPLAEALGPMWEVVGIDPPGHVLGASEAPLTSISALVDALDGHVAPDLASDGYLLGYSVGGYVAHALVERWERAGRDRPRGLILCAVNPPGHRDAHPVYSSLDDDALIDALEGLGSASGPVLERRALFDMFKHVVRAGFLAYETAPKPAGAIRTPVLAVGGRDDPLARPSHLDEWRRYCSRFEVTLIDGEHIFLPQRRAELARLVDGFAAACEDD